MKSGDWHGVGKQKQELGIDGWEIIIFFKNAIAYRGFHCSVYPETEVESAIKEYIATQRTILEDDFNGEELQ